MNLQDAIRRSILTEKSAMLFYQHAAARMTDTAARKTFELLAREEAEHAGQFFSLYQGTDLGDFATFIAHVPEGGSEWLGGLDAAEVAGLKERQAMELAMKNEQQLEQQLRHMAAMIDDPQVRAVYLENAESTHNHYMVIESEYARLMGMVHESDIDTYVRE
jgi:rubrerythrin